VVTDASLARLVFEGDKNRGISGADKDQIYHRLDAGMLGVHNLFTKRTHGEGWEWARKAIAPAFSNLNVNSKIPILQEALSKVFHILDEYDSRAHQFDIHNFMTKFILDFTTISLFGISFDALGGEETLGNKFIHEIEILIKEYYQKQFHNPFRKYMFWNKEVQRGAKAKEFIETFFKKMLDDYRSSKTAEDIKTDTSLFGQMVRRYAYLYT